MGLGSNIRWRISHKKSPRALKQISHKSDKRTIKSNKYFPYNLIFRVKNPAESLSAMWNVYQGLSGESS